MASEASTPPTDSTLIVDLHAHPANKVYLWNRKLHKRNRSGGALNPWAMRVDLPSLKDGGVDVVVSAIYLLERKLPDDCFLVSIARFFAPRRIKKLFKGNRFERTVELIQHFEARVSETPTVGGVELEIAKSHRQLAAILERGNIAIVHSVEGAHSLENDPDNVARLFDLGVCMLTLAHFYFNGAVWPVDGIPGSMKPPFCFRWDNDLSKGLEPLGRRVVEEMVRLGMIIDMTHSTPIARRETLSLVNGRSPVIMSHVGVASMLDHPMNPSDDEIGAIADTGGVVGVIAMNPWLWGIEQRDGLDLIVKTVHHIKRHGGIEAAAVGTDFDGFTDPPDDFSDPSMFPALSDALSRSGMSEDQVELVLGGNARRVLRDGWRR